MVLKTLAMVSVAVLPVFAEEAKPQGDAKSAAAATKSSFSPEQQGEITQIVKEAINSNPEVVIKAIQGYSEKQEKEQLIKTQGLIDSNKDKILNQETSGIIGNVKGAAKLIVFVDPNCPHCRQFEKILHKVKASQPDLGIYYRPWAILGESSASVVRGLIAAKLQDKFEAISDLIAQSEGEVTLPVLIDFAKKAGADVVRLKKDMESEKVIAIVQDNKGLAEALGLQGTPTSILLRGDALELINPTDEASLVAFLKGEKPADAPKNS